MLADLPAKDRRAMYFSMGKALAWLHNICPEEIGLGDFGRPGSYGERQLSRWTKQYNQSPSPRIPALDQLMTWLGEMMPKDDARVSIADGDFRLGNMIFHPTRPEVVAILDWELSTLGHRLADLGFCCMPWYTAPDEYGGILGGITRRRAYRQRLNF